MIQNKISGLHYTECFPERTELIQYIVEPRGIGNFGEGGDRCEYNSGL